jgi:hypothetical protein
VAGRVTLQPIRLLREHRGTPAGSVITATPGMAERLIASGIAEEAHPGDLPARPVAERAVAPTGLYETRG